MEDVWHESLEPHILDACNVLGSLEVVRGSIGPAFPRVVDHCIVLDQFAGRAVAGESHSQYWFMLGSSPSGSDVGSWTYLGDLSQGSSFFTEVNDNTTSTILGFFDCLLDAENEIRAACANVGPEDVTSIALSRLVKR